MGMSRYVSVYGRMFYEHWIVVVRKVEEEREGGGMFGERLRRLRYTGTLRGERVSFVGETESWLT